MKKYIKIIVFSFLLFNGFAFSQLFGPNESDPVDLTAGTTTYRWEIERLLLESKNKILPYIIQGDNELTATTIIYDYETEIGYAYGNVVFENNADNTRLTADQGTYYTENKKVIVTGDPVLEMEDSDTTAKADTMIFYSDQDYVIMIGDVNIEGEDYNLEGDKATYYQSTGKFKLDGQAGTEQNGMELTADQIDISSRNNELENYTAIGNVEVLNDEDGYIIRCGRLEYFQELGYIRMTEDPEIEFIDKDIKAYALVMEQFEDEDRANLLGNVIIVQGDQKAYGRWGEYVGEEDVMYLTGNPILVSGDSMFDAHQVVMDIDAEEMYMIGGGTGYFDYQ